MIRISEAYCSFWLIFRYDIRSDARQILKWIAFMFTVPKSNGLGGFKGNELHIKLTTHLLKFSYFEYVQGRHGWQGPQGLGLA